MRKLAMPLVALAALAAGTLLAAPTLKGSADPAFPHDKHARMFPLCSTCHAGITEAGQPVFPEPLQCGSCHDSVVEPRVAWTPRAGPRPTNLRFAHDRHHVAATAKNPGDSTLAWNCSSCHVEAGTPRMHIRPSVVQQCLTCHGLPAPHVDNPAESCATCHVPVTEARLLTREDILNFPRPASHDSADFLLVGHGRQAQAPGVHPSTRAIASSCATCHARNLCVSCHVNAPESPVIMSLALDDRLATRASVLPVPPSHAASDFPERHGRDATRRGATCATCHTRESCATCHVRDVPRVVAALPAAGDGRAPGAHSTRAAPRSHTREFRERHGDEASARQRSCETCHERSSCLECHRPDNGRQSRYHPQNFLTRHPASAYSRETTCADCHNAAQFCQSCHQQAGLVATSRIGVKGYHDAFRGFSLGHGQAARQSLESCASCHAERDCTACHSAVGGGFRFNPHGPGFNPARMRAKNPSVCVACHGRAIPGAPPVP